LPLNFENDSPLFQQTNTRGQRFNSTFSLFQLSLPFTLLMSFLRHKNGPLKNQLSKPTIIAIHQRESISANPWVQLIPKLCGTVCERQQNAALLISAKNHRRKPLKNKKYLSAAKKRRKSRKLRRQNANKTTNARKHKTAQREYKRIFKLRPLQKEKRELPNTLKRRLKNRPKNRFGESQGATRQIQFS